MITLKKMEFNPEFIGILATLFILLAFLKSGEYEIRIYDLIGAILFVIYGILIDSFSVYFLNAILIIIQIYKLYKLKKMN